MEVLTIISANKDTKSSFLSFLRNYKGLDFSGKDNDTLFYKKHREQGNQLYFHYDFLDFNEEVKYNYELNELEQIKAYFKTTDLYAFDISYKSEELLQELLNSFKNYLIAKGIYDQPILISHSLRGIVEFYSI